jgi:hypothetical protein
MRIYTVLTTSYINGSFIIKRRSSIVSYVSYAYAKEHIYESMRKCTISQVVRRSSFVVRRPSNRVVIFQIHLDMLLVDSIMPRVSLFSYVLLPMEFTHLSIDPASTRGSYPCSFESFPLSLKSYVHSLRRNRHVIPSPSSSRKRYIVYWRSHKTLPSPMRLPSPEASWSGYSCRR